VGILNLAHLSTDGTKQKANASNSHSLSKEEIEELRRILERGIAIEIQKKTNFMGMKGVMNYRPNSIRRRRFARR